MLEATLRLFKGISVNYVPERDYCTFDKYFTLKHGYIVDANVPCDTNVENAIESVVLTPEVNATFFSSWAIVKNTPQEVLFFHQMVHYITTYGLGQDGYIPGVEFRSIGRISNVHIQYIKALHDGALINGINTLGAGIALSDQTLEDIITIIKAREFPYNKFTEIKNKELKTRINKLFNIVPTAPLEFLHHWLYEVTGETLIIKNAELLDKIKTAENIDALIPKAPKDLASIFYRYKPIFLALKKGAKNKTFFNQLRRKAVNQHKPMKEDLVATAIHRCVNGISSPDLLVQLGKASIYRKFRLLNEVCLQLNGTTNAVVYKIRNGKTWTTTRELGYTNALEGLRSTLLLSIFRDINVKDKTFYIPKYINYALPKSEKDYIGNIPCGSFISIPEDMVFGIHWYNVEGRQTDLDLSTISIDGKVGWDTGHRSTERDLLFSGDLTNAPLPVGANEVFYVKKSRPQSELVTVNYYNYDSDFPVPSKIFVASKDVWNDKAMVDIDNVLMSASFTIDTKYQLLGLRTRANNGNNNFYFQTGSFGNIISARANERTTQAREFFTEKLRTQWTLNGVLNMLRARIVEKYEEGCIDLSPDSLDKTTIIDLFTSI